MTGVGGDGTTFCSIVVPTFNRPERLAVCLAAIARQDYPRSRYEVVVVDDGGASSLDRVVTAAASDVRLRLLRKENGGPALARNFGVERAEGELIAFTDDDCAPDASWLSTLEAAHRAAPDALLGGHTRNALPGDPYATASQLLIDYLYEYYGSARAVGGRFFTSNNMAVGRTPFLDAGGFDPSFRRAAGEDRELCAVWKHQGRPLVYVPEAQVAHAHAMTLRAFGRQHLDYGRAAYRFRVREAARDARGVRVEPLRFYSEMLRFPFRRLGVVDGARTAALIVIAQATNAAGFFMARRRERA